MYELSPNETRRSYVPNLSRGVFDWHPNPKAVQVERGSPRGTLFRGRLREAQFQDRVCNSSIARSEVCTSSSKTGTQTRGPTQALFQKNRDVQSNQVLCSFGLELAERRSCASLKLVVVVTLILMLALQVCVRKYHGPAGQTVPARPSAFQVHINE